MLRRWRLNCRRSQIANYNSSNRFTSQNYWIGVPTAILSAFVATSVFATLGKSIDPYIQICIGLVSVLVAILVTLQTYLKRDELASKHRAIAAAYGSVKRHLDQQIVRLEAGDEVLPQTVDGIRERMDGLSADGPTIPKKIWNKALTSTPAADNTVPQ